MLDKELIEKLGAGTQMGYNFLSTGLPDKSLQHIHACTIDE